MNILFTSPGKRVELIKIFRENLSPDSLFYGTDFDCTSPALYFLDKIFKVPYKIDEIYVDIIFKICKKNSVDIVIPLIDPELLYLSKARDAFLKQGIFIMVSRIEMIEIALDKWKTYKFISSIGVSTPNTSLNLKNKKHKFPIIVKPRWGSASKNILIINSKRELEMNRNIIENRFIIQEYLKGEEITVDVFGTEDGKCIEAVQRKRLKVRAGEVERGVTQKNISLFEVVEKFVKYYKPNGVINLQFIWDINYQLYKMIEINPRFGGGYPLAYRAGANFPKLLIKLFSKEYLTPCMGSYKNEFYMFRFDSSVYTDKLAKLC